MCFFCLPAWVLTLGIHPSGQHKKQIFLEWCPSILELAPQNRKKRESHSTLSPRCVFLFARSGVHLEYSPKRAKQKNTFSFRVKWLVFKEHNSWIQVVDFFYPPGGPIPSCIRSLNVLETKWPNCSLPWPPFDLITENHRVQFHHS